jgi:hypothetical protein
MEIKGTPKAVCRFVVMLVIASAASVAVMAQSATQKTVPEQVQIPPAASAATDVDETFELNIVERRYSQENFEASTAVATTSDDNKLSLQVGVALAAGRIELLLRNVHGVVRFRGTLNRLLQVINDRQTASPIGSQSPSTPPRPNPN